MDYRARKQKRKDYYEKYVHGKKLVVCTACSGSDYYDMLDKKGRSIKCGCCEGTGKIREGE